MNDNDDDQEPDVGRPERARKVVLSTSVGNEDRLTALVAQWQRDRIAWVAIVGADCVAIEQRIKSLLAADAANRTRFVMTSSHPTETIEVAIVDL
jgi:hypothetical protein